MDPNTPPEETMGALAQAVRSGKVLYAGLSTNDGPTLEKAAAILDELHVPFVINQNRYSIFDRTIEHNGLKDTAAKLHKGIITFSPLAQGLLTDRYLHGIPADSRVHTDGRFLKEKDITPERLAQISARTTLPGSAVRPWPRWPLPGCCTTTRSQRFDRCLQNAADSGQHQGRGAHDVHARRVGRDRQDQQVKSIYAQAPPAGKFSTAGGGCC